MDDSNLASILTVGSLIGFLISGWMIFCIWRARCSGWVTLSTVYGSRVRRDVPARRFQTIQFRPSRLVYRNSINMRLTVDGLHLLPAWYLRGGHRPLLIPWDEISIFAVDTYPADRLYDLRFAHEPLVTLRVGVKVAQLVRRASDNAQYFNEDTHPQPAPPNVKQHNPAA